MLLERLLQLLIRDQPLLDKDLAQLFGLLLRGHHRARTDGLRELGSRFVIVIRSGLLKQA